MLPLMSNLKTKLIAGTVAAALLATSAAPAMAWGKNEQNVAKGALAVLLLGAIMRDADHHSREQQQPVYNQPVYRAPVYYQDEPRRHHDDDQPEYPREYQQPVYQQPVYQQPIYQAPMQSYYNTPAAMAFNSYSPDERLRIQGTLANYGYYHGRVDGSFGPGTYQALTAYATQSGKMAMLETRGGAFGLMDGLLY